MGATTARILRLVPVVVAAVLLLLLASAVDAASASASALDDAAATRCAATIVSISPCLPHVAAVLPPLALAGSGYPPAPPTDACCVAFLRAVAPAAAGGGQEGCLCHLLRDPLLLGFPIDAARLAALLPACAAGNAFAAATVEAATLFADACRELKALPELHFMPQSTARQEISPAAVPELLSKPMEAVPPAGSMVRSAAEVSSSHGIPIAASILAAAGAAITLLL